jgi:hypothetical protein
MVSQLGVACVILIQVAPRRGILLPSRTLCFIQTKRAPKMCIPSVIIIVLAVFTPSMTHASNQDNTYLQLDTIQEKSNALWELNDDIRYYALPNNLALGAVGFVFGGLNLNDGLKPNHQTQHQGVAGALYLGAGLSGLSASLLHGLGENSVDNYRWHRGLTGATFLLGGSAALLRGLDSVKEA